MSIEMFQGEPEGDDRLPKVIAYPIIGIICIAIWTSMYSLYRVTIND